MTDRLKNEFREMDTPTGTQAPNFGDKQPLPELRILLVDDNQSAAHMMGRLLQKLGQVVYVANSGSDALVRVPQVTPDIIISDVSMPVMTGPEMLQEADPEMIGKAKVLFLSGYAPESFSHMLEQYPVHYLSKPVTMEQLVGRVKELLAAA